MEVSENRQNYPITLTRVARGELTFVIDVYSCLNLLF